MTSVHGPSEVWALQPYRIGLGVQTFFFATVHLTYTLLRDGHLGAHVAIIDNCGTKLDLPCHVAPSTEPFTCQSADLCTKAKMSNGILHNPRPSKRRRLSSTTVGNEAGHDADDLASSDARSSASNEGGSLVDSEEEANDVENSADVSHQDRHEYDSDVQDDADEEYEAEGDVPVNGNHSATIQQTSQLARPIQKAVHNLTWTRPVVDAAPTNSSLFSLQVDELLRRSKPSYDQIQEQANELLRKLKITIESLPGRDLLPLKDAEKHLLKSQRVPIPFPTPRPANDVKYKFGYAKPTSINVVGSYAMKTASKHDSGITIDLVVHMPEHLFESKDYLNYRYFHKRAYYLASIAAGLQANPDLDLKLEFSPLHDNALLPVLIARPDTEKHSSTLRIQIMPVISANFFPNDKTLPSRNCVRTSAAAVHNEQPIQLPTPFYNASLRVDTAVNGYLKLLHGTNARCPSFRDACILGRIWLSLRGFTSSVAEGGFGGFEWAVVMALLFETGGVKGRPLLSESHNIMQLFGGTLHFLTQRDLIKNPMAPSGQAAAYEQAVPMLFDVARGVNVLYKMTASSYRSLKEDARIASRLFGTNSTSRFDSLFVTRVSQPLLRYDVVFQVPADVNASQSQHMTLQKLHETISRGLGDRVTSVNVWSTRTDAWSINASHPQRKALFSIGLALDPVNSARSVDRGPSAEDVEGTASFREFWGDKAELRRFKDGEIRESLVWSTNEASEVTKQIVFFLLKRHAGLKSEDEFKVAGSDFSGLTALSSESTAQASQQKAVTAYRLLETTIRGLEGLPLQIQQIQPSGIKLRNTHIDTSFSKQHHASSPTDIVLQFEGSGRWPSDITAIQMTKIAFLLKLSELLSVSSTIDSTRIGLENETSDTLNKAFLDITISPSDETFRLRIHHDREAPLLERLLADKTISPRSREDAASALAEYKRTFIRAPLHTQTMQKLCTQFPAYAPTVRLLKSWLSAQLLGNHFRVELVEMLAMKVFLDPLPWTIPSSAITGFLCTIAFLARWDWQIEPLILDASTSMNKAERSAIATKFEAWRKIDPGLNRVAMFVATGYDTDGVTWSEYNPSKVVAARMSGLARAAYELVDRKGLDLDVGSLFRPSLKEYDFLIRLRKGGGSAKERKTNGAQFKNLMKGHDVDTSLAGYDPVALYLEELQRVYGDAALLFCNTIEQDIIAGLWSPHTARRRWKVNLGWSTQPVENNLDDVEEEGSTDVTINKVAMLAEMARLGGDLVRSVEMQT